MDRYYQNSSNSAPGFVYFNQNTSQDGQNKSDTNDFLAFSDVPQASPQTNRFKPAYYSSPQSNYYRGNARNYPPNNRKKYQRWSGGNRSYNSSYNSSFNQSSSLQEDEDSDIAKFIHPSFLEDPWVHLEARLKEQTEQTQSHSQINETSQSEAEET